MSGGRRLIVIGAVVLAVLVALRVLGELTKRRPARPGPGGLLLRLRAATARPPTRRCCERSGHEVVRLRDDLADLDLDPRFTVVLLWPDAITSERRRGAAPLRRARRPARGRRPRARRRGSPTSCPIRRGGPTSRSA